MNVCQVAISTHGWTSGKRQKLLLCKHIGSIIPALVFTLQPHPSQDSITIWHYTELLTHKSSAHLHLFFQELRIKVHTQATFKSWLLNSVLQTTW